MAGQAYDVITEFWRIQDDGDYSAMVDLFADDAVLEDALYGRQEGKAAIGEFMETMNKEAANNPFSFTAQEISGDESTAWCRWLMTTPRGETEGVGVYKVADGKMTYYRDYYDVGEVARLSGVDPREG